jgi:hypothetical protein
MQRPILMSGKNLLNNAINHRFSFPSSALFMFPRRAWEQATKGHAPTNHKEVIKMEKMLKQDSINDHADVNNQERKTSAVCRRVWRRPIIKRINIKKTMNFGGSAPDMSTGTT